MNIWHAIILGLVQGITEFIPVSSSGHLELTQKIFQFSGEGFHYFLEFINIGTLLALLWYFRKRIWRIVQNIFKQKNYKLAINIVITSVPAGLVGLLLGGLIEDNEFFGAMITVCVAMGLVGLVMMAVDKLPHLSKLDDENDLTPGRALVIGLSQVLALIPGTSRSATTIVTGRIMGLDSESAAEYSFLASIPLMCGVCLKAFIGEGSQAYFMENLWPLLIGNIVAFVVGLFALKFVLSYLKRPKSLQKFGVYRVILACIVIGVLLVIG